MPNLTYPAVTERMCRNCHGESLADRHHDAPLAQDGKCGRCHEGEMSPGAMSVSHVRDCKKCHIESPHHATVWAKKMECVTCHKTGVSAYSTVAPTHRTTSVTPEVDVCFRCHVKSEVREGESYPVKLTHHETGIKECSVCHGENPGERNIGLCRRCHNHQAVHNVMVHQNKKECRNCHRK